MALPPGQTGGSYLLDDVKHGRVEVKCLSMCLSLCTPNGLLKMNQNVFLFRVVRIKEFWGPQTSLTSALRCQSGCWLFFPRGQEGCVGAPRCSLMAP